MRSRLLLLGAGALTLALVAGDALSRQTAAPARPGAARVAPGALNTTRVAQTNPAGAPNGQPGGPPAAGSGVDWKSAIVAQRRGMAAGGQGLGANLDPAEVDKTALPILLPLEPGLVAPARLYSFGDFYALSTELPGAGLSFQGNKAPIHVDAALAVNAEGPENFSSIRTIEGRIASFTRYGVLYSVEITCDEQKDQRCVSDAYLRQLVAKTTVVVLGKAARQAAGMGG